MKKILTTFIFAFTLMLPVQAVEPVLNDYFDFTGVLTDELGQPVLGTVQKEFTVNLYTSEIETTPIFTQPYSSVDVIDGVFTLRVGPGLFSIETEIDPKWIEISFRDAGSSDNFTVLSRVEANKVPFALAATTADTAEYAYDAESLGGQSAMFYMDKISSIENTIATSMSEVVMALASIQADSASSMANIEQSITDMESYLSSDTNYAETQDTLVLGGSQNSSLAESSAIIAGSLNGIGTEAYSSFIGGGEANTISDYSVTSAIAGGASNSISGDNSFIGGGAQNSIEGNDNFIAAGSNNSIVGDSSTILGGQMLAITGNNSLGYNATGTLLEISRPNVVSFNGVSMGINTTDPEVSLDVIGDAIIEGNLEVGDGDLYYLPDDIDASMPGYIVTTAAALINPGDYVYDSDGNRFLVISISSDNVYFDRQESFMYYPASPAILQPTYHITGKNTKLGLNTKAVSTLDVRGDVNFTSVGNVVPLLDIVSGTPVCDTNSNALTGISGFEYYSGLGLIDTEGNLFPITGGSDTDIYFGDANQRCSDVGPEEFRIAEITGLQVSPDGISINPGPMYLNVGTGLQTYNLVSDNVQIVESLKLPELFPSDNSCDSVGKLVFFTSGTTNGSVCYCSNNHEWLIVGTDGICVDIP